MRYHYEKSQIATSMYGEVYKCNHPVYDTCVLFKINDKGLAVIQQRYNAKTKHAWWCEVEPWLVDKLYLHPKFKEVFYERAGECKDGLYPTITVRQLM